MAEKEKKYFWDCEEAVTRTTPHFLAVSEVLSLLVLWGGILVLAGWALDLPALKSIFPDLVNMKANTALCFVFSGASLWLLQIKRRDDRRFQKMAQVLSGGVFAIGLLTFLEYMFGWNLWIDQFLFEELPGAILTSSPGRMALNTAINFTIAGWALFFLASKTRGSCLFSQVLMLPVGIISVLSFIGYLYKASPPILGLSFSTTIALHTMLLSLALFFGMLFSRPGCGIMTLVSSETIGGKMVRWISPVVMVIPILLGWLKLKGERLGLISNELGVSLVAIGNFLFATVYIYVLSFQLDKSDSRRMKSEAVIHNSEEKHRSIFENSRDALMTLAPPSWKFASGNLATIEMFRVADENQFVSLGPWELSPERQPDGSASAEKIKDMINKAVQEGHCVFEWTHKRIDGEEFPAMVLLTRIGQDSEMILLAAVRDSSLERRSAQELKKKIEELERFNRIAVGREIKMIELKEQLKTLAKGGKT
jgi:PAS domain-containing protein